MIRQARGIRNNNPFNIEHNSTQWQGLDQPPSDGRFCRFVSPEYGIRAGCRILITYQQKYGLKDVTAIINRFAPPVENDTGAYIHAVARAVGVGAGEPIDVKDATIMRRIVNAIIRHENGYNPYPDSIVTRGMKMAGIDVKNQSEGDI